MGLRNNFSIESKLNPLPSFDKVELATLARKITLACGLAASSRNVSDWEKPEQILQALKKEEATCMNNRETNNIPRQKK